MIHPKIKQSAFLFAGTAIGAGMLALPIASGASGFLPSLVYISLWFIYSLSTLYLLLECMGYQSLSEDSGFISMSQQLSGPIGRRVIQISYLLLLYAVTSAYVIGGGQLLNNTLSYFNCTLATSTAAVIFSAFFSILAMQSMQVVGKINQWLMYLLMAAFICMLLFLASNMNLGTLLSSQELYLLIPSTSIIVLSFACHNLLPTILHYLEGDAKNIRQAILYGMFLPLAIYLLWNAVIIGSLPTSGAGSIVDIQMNHASHGGELAMLAKSLEHTGLNNLQGLLDKFFITFGLCAIITSYIGVTLSLKDFVIQGVNLQKHRSKDLIGILFIYVPSVIFALYFPHGFSMVLGYAGIIVAYLFGLTPVLWAWNARHRLKLVSRYPSGISNTVLIFLGLLSTGIMLLQLQPPEAHETHEGSSPIAAE